MTESPIATPVSPIHPVSTPSNAGHAETPRQMPQGISSMGLGCASAWGQPWFSEQKAIAVVHRAIELGVNVFDTGPTYSGGFAEPRLGKALAGRDTSGMLISTKVGTLLRGDGRLYKDWSRAAIEASVEASRQRLGLDTIPLLYLHGPRPGDFTPELFDTLEGLRSRGVIRWIGINSFDDDVLELMPDFPSFDVIMLDYNLLRVQREPLIERLHAAGKLVVAGAALANHMVAPRFLFPKSKVELWYLLRLLKNYRGDFLRARKLSFLERETGVSPAQAALAYIQANPYVALSMFSTTSIAHLEENLQAKDKQLSEAVLSRIRQLG